MPDTKLESWVFRIMQTVWFNELRYRNIRDRHGSDAPSQGDAEPNEPGEAVAETRVVLKRVEHEIQQPPEKERMVLLLVCAEGLTYREAADVAGIPIGTIMSRLARARRTLMNRLDDVGHFPADNVRSFGR